MMYVGLDCLMRMNPKIAALKSSTCWFFVCCIGYANQYQTGGFVPLHAMPSLWTSKQEPRFQHRKHLADLVAARLLVLSGDAYRIPDYFDYQLSPETTEQRRAGHRLRQQRRRTKLVAEATAERAWKHKPLVDGADDRPASHGRDGNDASVAARSPAPAVSTTRSMTSDESCDLPTTPSVQTIFGHISEIVEVNEEHHAVASRYVTRQSKNRNSSSEQIYTDASKHKAGCSPQTLAAESDAASAFALFAKESGWGVLPASLSQKFEDLDPFFDRAELTLVHRTIERQMTVQGRQIDSYAGYALRVLQNRRTSGVIRPFDASKPPSISGPTVPANSRQLDRESKLELYEALSDNLSGTHWHASLTMGTIDLLRRRGLTTASQVLSLIASSEGDNAEPRSWPAIVDAIRT